MVDGAAAPTSYSAQFDALFAAEKRGQPPRARLDTRQRLPKPSMDAQAAAPGARRIPWSRVWATVKRGNWLGREPWSFVDVVVRLVGGWLPREAPC